MVPCRSSLDRSPFIVVTVLILATAVTPEARAACNAIPDAESAAIGATKVLVAQDPTTPATPVDPGLIGFKCALGRTDRLHLLPGYTTSFRIQPDAQCVQAGEDGKLIVRELPEARGNAALDGSNLVVSLFTKPAGEGSILALVLGSANACGVFNTDDEDGPHDGGVKLRCEPLPPEIEPREGGGFNVRVRLPNHGDLVVAGRPLRGPVTILVTPRPQSRAEHEALLSMIAAGGCAEHCTTLADNGALGCLDLVYLVLANGTAVSDPVPCAVAIPPKFTRNVFKEKCENLLSPDLDLAQCDDNGTVLQLWEDQCGGVHIPFDWTAIRQDTSTTPPTDVTRVVAGRSATARVEKGNLNDPRIWIPGREFMGSTPWSDPQGTMATTDWRKPDIDVWYPAGPSEEIGLRGSVDKADSIVHVFPRMPVSLACAGVSGDEACMGVEGGGGISCACRDRYPASCLCRKLDPPKLFACEGGDFDHMPCTRHAHCNSKPGSANPDGTCSRKPTCRKADKTGVWPFPGSPPGTGCWIDDTCKQVAQHPVCGYRLFDLSDRKQPSIIPDLIELDAEIVSGGRMRRGVCKKDRKNLCNPANPCRAAGGKCRGYTLRAEGKKP